MALQSSVNTFYTTGFVGEIIKDGPLRATTWDLNGQTTNPNQIGYAFTATSTSGVAQVGGTGAFAGILVNPKDYALFGTQAGGTLAPSIILPPYYTGAQLLTMGIIVCNFTTAVSYGDPVYFAPDNTDSDLVGGLYNADRTTPGRKLIPNARIISTTTAAGLAVVAFTQ